MLAVTTIVKKKITELHRLRKKIWKKKAKVTSCHLEVSKLMGDLCSHVCGSKMNRLCLVEKQNAMVFKN